MIELKISKEILENANSKAIEMGALNNSIRKGNGNFVGFVGEHIVSEYLGIDLDNSYDYDIVVGGYPCDIKTKECTSPPEPHYECSIAAFNTKQECKVYIFVRVCDDVAWLLGWMPKTEYFEKARFLKKGQVDKSNGFVVKADCYNLAISELYPFPPRKDKR